MTRKKPRPHRPFRADRGGAFVLYKEHSVLWLHKGVTVSSIPGVDLTAPNGEHPVLRPRDIYLGFSPGATGQC